MEKRNVPKLRFKGFEDEWRSLSIGNTLKIKHGKDQKKIISENGIYPILGTGGEIGRTNTPIYSKESVLIGRKGTIDKPFYMNSPFWTVDTLFYSEILDGFYAKLLFYSFQRINWKKYSEASGVPSLSASTIENIKYNIPKLEEQTKIANFLSNVDNIIEEQEGKVKDLEQYKKGMMQKIFKQEVRFRDENGGEYPEWEEKKFSDIFQNFEYGMNSAAKVFDGINKYIRITDIDDSSNKYISEKKVSPNGKLDNKYLVKENDILFARTGASVGKTYLYDKKDGILYFAGFLIRGNVIKEYDARYIFIETISEKYKRWVKVMSTRSGQPGINSLEYASYKFKCPCLKEQVKIANFLSNIDNIIEEEKKKLEDLKLWKRGLLQQMFV